MTRAELPLHRRVVATVSGLLAEARGEHEAASAGFAAAATGWHEFGMVYEEGQALLGQGRCLVALGERRRRQCRSLQPARSSRALEPSRRSRRLTG